MSAPLTYAPALEPADGLFPALLDGLKLFRARVEGVDVDPESADLGLDRARLLSLQGHSGMVVDVVKATLGALVDFLIWLRDTITDLELWIAQADALFAVIELLGAGLQGLGETMGSVDWPADLPVKGTDFDVIGEVGAAITDFGDLDPPSVIPRSTTLIAIANEAAALVGTNLPPTTGSLQQLLQLIDAPAP